MIALLLTSLLSLIYGRLIISSPEKAVYYFIPYNYLFDLIFFSTDVSVATISTVIRVMVLVGFLIMINKGTFFSREKPGFTFFVLISLILLISSLFGGGDTKSLLETVKFILIIFSLFAFLVYFGTHSIDLKQFKRMIFQLSAITIINILISNILSLGWGGYSDDVGFYTGGIISNMWYIPALILTASVAVINLVKKESNLWFSIAAVIVMLILIVALRRSAYIILLISLLGALLYLKIRLRVLRVVIVIMLVAAAGTPFFLPLLEKQVEARTKTFDKGVDEESRVKETEVLWTHRFDMAETPVLLFGEKPFDSAGNYGYGSFGDRPLHVDMNIVFFSSGLIGIILYALFFLSLLRYYLRLSRKFPKRSGEVRTYRYLFFSSFFSMVALSFSGGLNAITYRMFGFMLLAIALGQLKYMYANKQNSKI